MIDTEWSKLLDSDLGDYVMSRMDSNPSLKYHNGDHVRRLYEIAKKWRIPYDINLDAAILFHDAVYDNQPDKELRSAELVKETAVSMPEWFEDIDVSETNKMILTTAGHKVIPEVSPLMLKLDLAELGDDNRREENFWNILQESRNLYDIDTPTAAQGTLTFMRPFLVTMYENRSSDVDDTDYWNEIIRGVEETLTMATTIVNLYDRELT